MKNIITLLCTLSVISACYDENDYDILAIDPNEVIVKIESDNDTLLANGSSRTTIRVYLPENTDVAKSTISATTSNGIFTENNTTSLTKQATLHIVNDSIKSWYAEFILKSPFTEGVAIIKFKVASLEKEFKIAFEKNYLESVKITPSSLVIFGSSRSDDTNSNEIEIITTISSSSGVPSTGQIVLLYAKDSLYNEIGTFRTYSNKSDSEGECNFHYSILPDSTYFGKLFLIAVGQAKTGSVTDTVTIYSKK